jgi:hypothetical protein
MRFPAILFAGAMMFLSACSTPPKESYQQAYECWLTDGSVTMMTLHKLDSGDVKTAKKMMMTQLFVTLDGLPDFSAQAHPTNEQKQDEIKLARDILDYMLKHREDFDPRLPTVRVGVRAMRKILTEPDDLRRLTELSDYLAGVEKKMSETQKP